MDMSTEEALSLANIMVDDPSVNICNFFGDCMIPFYECLFIRVGLRLPFLNLR